MNNDYYRLPAPGGAVYLVTLQRGCVSCDGPSGVTIERFKNKATLKSYCMELPPELPLEKWPESFGACIATSHLKHEFVDAMKNGLIGLKSEDFTDEIGTGLDETAAETILEDMYNDSIFTPTLVETKVAER